ncbi:MAG: hypothetical protein HYX71_00415 [Opitutae bacterium]|nr:hypothetical protein [Opitutae bacterium]
MNARIYAVLASLVALGLGVALGLKLRDNAGLAAQVTRLSRQNADLRYELKQASRQATEVGQRAVELDSQLGSVKARTTATETKNQLLTRELTAREQREVSLMAELAGLRQRSASNAAEQPAGASHNADQPPPGDVEPYRRRIAELEQQLIQLLARSLAETPAEAASPTESPAPQPHQVVRVGPGDTFVVLDYGAEHGARPQAIFRLRRGTSELAQVQISDVRPRFSLAQVLPGTVKGQLQTGDLVVFNP